MHKLSKQIGVRLTQNLYELLKHISTARGEDVSDFVRRAIKMELGRLSFLTDEEKKSLGLPRVDLERDQEG